MDDRLISRVREAFEAPALAGPIWWRLARVTDAVRVAVGALALAFAGFLPGVTTRQRALFVGLVGLLYLPYSIAALAAGRQRRLGVRVATLAGDLVVVFAFQVLLPPTRVVALLGYLLLLSLHASLGGLAAGGVVAVFAVALSVAAQAINPSPPRIDAYTMVMYGAVLAFVCVLLAASSRALRQANARLCLLHDSLRRVASAVGLGEMLDAVASSARQALGGAFAVVYVRHGDTLRIGAACGRPWSLDAVRRLGEVTDPDHPGASGLALRTGRPVVVEDVRRDARFASWVPFADFLGVYAMVAVPLAVGEQTAGVLAVYFPRPRRISADDLDVAQGLADQAAVACARAAAHDRERTALGRLRELDHLRGQFVSAVSHELRTPLTCIEGFSDTLERSWAALREDQRRELIRRIRRNAAELRSLVERILDYARLDAGWAEVKPRPLELRRAIAAHLEARAPALGGHPVELDAPPGLEVEADPDGLDRILGNLLVNAARFSPPGAPIRVSARAEGLEAVVSVTDRGPGIPPEELEEVFKPFFQGSRQVSGRKGTGLGLAVAARYVELHGGRLWAHSRPGQGATFSFTLPLAYVARRPPPGVLSAQATSPGS